MSHTVFEATPADLERLAARPLQPVGPYNPIHHLDLLESVRKSLAARVEVKAERVLLFRGQGERMLAFFTLNEPLIKGNLAILLTNSTDKSLPVGVHSAVALDSGPIFLVDELFRHKATKTIWSHLRQGFTNRLFSAKKPYAVSLSNRLHQILSPTAPAELDSLLLQIFETKALTSRHFFTVLRAWRKTANLTRFHLLASIATTLQPQWLRNPQKMMRFSRRVTALVANHES